MARSKLDQLLKYADKRGIPLPSDVIMELAKAEIPAPVDVPIFDMNTPGLVPAPGKPGLVLYSEGWGKPKTSIQRQAIGNTGFVDAPIDGSIYGRRNGAWTVAGETAASILAKLLTVDGTGSLLDADLLDGQHGAYYLPAASYTAADVLVKLLTVDGAGSGLDADLLDGEHASAFQDADAFLASIAALGTAADKLIYTTGVDTAAETGITAAMRGLIGETNTKGAFINDALIDGANPDMGYLQTSNKSGYYTDFITDKGLYNVILGGSARTINGGLRVNVSNDPDTLEIYLRGAWYTILYDFTTANGDLRHTPLSEAIYVWRGDSVTTGLNGRSIVQEYEASMGAYPPPRVLYGGTF